MPEQIKTVVIVDDDNLKIRAAEDIVHSVFHAGVDIEMIYVQGSHWNLEDLVTNIMMKGPHLLILDSMISPCSSVLIQGSEVARDLKREFEACAHDCIIVANTHGVTGWSEPLTQRFFERVAGVTLGAGDNEQLRQVLEQIRDGEVDT